MLSGMATLRRRDVLAGLAAAVLGPARAGRAQKPQPAVGARWERVPATTRVGRWTTVTLRVTAHEDAPRLTIRLLPAPGVEVKGPAQPRPAALTKGSTLALPVSFRVVRDGTCTLGASVTNSQPADEQVSGAVIAIVARRGTATLTNQSPGAPPLFPLAPA